MSNLRKNNDSNEQKQRKKLKNLSLPDNDAVSLDALLKEVENLSRVDTTREILKFILKNVEPINFRIEAKLEQDEKSVKRKHYLILVVDKVNSLAESLGLNICYVNQIIFIYNGQYWVDVNKTLFINFLKDCGIKMGVEWSDAKYFHFKEDLFKQFASESYQKPDGGNTNAIKINLKNGTFEFVDGRWKLRSFAQEDFLKYQLNFDYNENADCPQFQSFLDFVLPEKELQLILAEYIGSIFINRNVLKLEKILLLYGGGSNGKGVFFEIIKALLGKENLSNYTLEELTKNDNSRSNIEDKLLNFGSESSERLNTTLLKSLASKEPVQIRRLYKNVYTMEDYASLAFNVNELPKDVEHNHGYFRRFIIIPFRVLITEAKQDKKLPQKIIANELSGIFNWVLDGLQRVINNEGFTESSIVEDELKNFKKESDSVLLFIDDCNYKQSTEEFRYQSDLHSEYHNFCQINGNLPCSNREFGKRLKTYQFVTQKKSKGKVVFIEKK